MFYELNRQDLLRLILGTVPKIEDYEDGALAWLKAFYVQDGNGYHWNIERVKELEDVSIFDMYKSVMKREN